MNKIFRITIIGRPNVGKSSLFNRVVGKRKAIVHERSGTTRDVIEEEIVVQGKGFILADTAGYLKEKGNIIINEALKKVDTALRETDLVWLVVDGKVSPTKEDQKIIDLVRKSGKKTFLIVNKVDNQKEAEFRKDYENFGFKNTFFVSVIHNRGVVDLIVESIKGLPENALVEEESEEEKKETRAVLIGRPNVGKSSIFNQITGEMGSIVADIPGTTRDVICKKISKNDDLVVCDTGGARRPGKIGKAYLAGEPVEKYAYLRMESEIENSDIVILVVDFEDGLAAQDLHLAGKVKESGKGLILVVNKWDLAEETTQEDFLKALRGSFGFVLWVPVIFVSAKTGRNISEIIPIIREIKERREQKISTPRLNRILEDFSLTNRPKGVKNIFPKVYFITQAGTNPPTFSIAAKNPGHVHFSWKRALENELRRQFDFTGTPIQIEFKANRRK